MCPTPACAAASITAPCWRTRSPIAVPETSRRVSAPLRASPSEAAEVSGGTGDDDGLVLREARPVVPPHVEYRLTGDGREVTDLLLPMVEWVQDHAGDGPRLSAGLRDGR
ncbi:winged helix-turn-helix transcriptional regulator [Nocardiopsis dassonvillei]